MKIFESAAGRREILLDEGLFGTAIASALGTLEVRDVEPDRKLPKLRALPVPMSGPWSAPNQFNRNVQSSTQ